MALLLFIAGLGGGERNGSSWNQKIIRALGLLLGSTRDLSPPAAGWGLDIRWVDLL